MLIDIIWRIIFLMDFYQSPSFLFLCLWLLDFDSELYWISFQPLTIITKHSILDVAAVLDPPLSLYLCQLLITLLVLCENSLKFLLCKSVLRRGIYPPREVGIPRSGDQIKRENQTPLRSVSVNNFLGDNVLYRLLLSKAITGPSFNFIPYVEVNVSGRFAHPSPKSFMYKELNVRWVKTWLKGSKMMKNKLKSWTKLLFEGHFS